jgi:hypothetical protein
MRLHDIESIPVVIKGSKSFGSYSRTIKFEETITVVKFGNVEDST